MTTKTKREAPIDTAWAATLAARRVEATVAARRAAEDADAVVRHAETVLRAGLAPWWADVGAEIEARAAQWSAVPGAPSVVVGRGPGARLSVRTATAGLVLVLVEDPEAGHTIRIARSGETLQRAPRLEDLALTVSPDGRIVADGLDAAGFARAALAPWLDTL